VDCCSQTERPWQYPPPLPDSASAVGGRTPVNKIAIALVLGAFLAVGCGDKTGTDASGSAKASSAAAKDSGKAAASGTAKADTGSSGSKTCDEYWTKVKA